ncbi:extensin-like domain-containing protein [Antarcticirhabdus aurantiaca]|uniref:Extensin family protein n=1 Tax=Antarcticirhabdus aurantiaca TaxID=2606717 RepID=A0ACD4NKN3_9HYPH|nr:extensin family protein [Antarcticirhabdus aurantiaca]WAJ27343.1 extensin family protein [Jeongeuplla avenae]
MMQTRSMGALGALLLILGATMSASGQEPAAGAVPVPSQKPDEAPATPPKPAEAPATASGEDQAPEAAVPADEADAPGTPPPPPPAETVPVPEAAPPHGAAPSPAPAPVPTAPEPALPPAAGSPDASAPPQPAPAYVSPEKARTEPEPDAPEASPATVTPAESAEAAAAIEDATACEAELTKRGAEFEVGPSLSEGACGVLRPVELKRFSSGVAVLGQTKMLCRAALALDVWVGEAVVPAAKAELGGASVEAVGGGSTYVCRDRASENGISEHGRGSAVDVAAVALKGGRRIVVEPKAPGTDEDRFLAEIRRAACGPFKTVLGPGTDADHADHLHLDIAARNNGSLYCR